MHLFGHDQGAWRLYQSMGHIERSIQMEKQL
jgi:hypothetical protein